eukprot:5407262-Amphidinium_carterae.1
MNLQRAFRKLVQALYCACSTHQCEMLAARIENESGFCRACQNRELERQKGLKVIGQTVAANIVTATTCSNQRHEVTDRMSMK